jgi:multiple sugar transport system ATP-binding protein
MAHVELNAVNKVYENGHHAVTDLTLSLGDGEFLVLVGPSGCGKSTALRMVAGLEAITSGDLVIDGKRMNDVPARDRDIAMVFQNYALYPQMTVADNIGFPLRLRKTAKSERESEVRRIAEILELTDQLEKLPAQLSGGQRQRVAMGRAIIRKPKLFLMDEPLSNLDAKLRVQMRADIRSIQREFGVTTLYVTHDQVEAMTMGDRVAVLKDGHLQQIAPPDEVYRLPANAFVASFIGSPTMNIFETTIDTTGLPTLQIGHQSVRMPVDFLDGRAGLSGRSGQPVIVGIRPEHFFEAGSVGGECEMTIEVMAREALGSEVIVYFDLGARQVVAGDPDVSRELTDRRARRFAARLQGRADVREGDKMTLRFDPAAVRFFDPATHRAIA